MVGPSITDEDRQIANLRLRIGFVLLVGASGGLVAYAVGASLPEVGIVAAAALALGVVLIWYLGRILAGVQSPPSRR